jgi:hypothetical protein
MSNLTTQKPLDFYTIDQILNFLENSRSFVEISSNIKLFLLKNPIETPFVLKVLKGSDLSRSVLENALARGQARSAQDQINDIRLSYNTQNILDYFSSQSQAYCRKIVDELIKYLDDWSKGKRASDDYIQKTIGLTVKAVSIFLKKLTESSNPCKKLSDMVADRAGEEILKAVIEENAKNEIVQIESNPNPYGSTEQERQSIRLVTDYVKKTLKDFSSVDRSFNPYLFDLSRMYADRLSSNLVLDNIIRQNAVENLMRAKDVLNTNELIIGNSLRPTQKFSTGAKVGITLGLLSLGSLIYFSYKK